MLQHFTSTTSRHRRALHRGTQLRLAVFFFATVVVLALGYRPDGEVREAGRPVGDRPHAAAGPVQSIAPQVVLTPVPRPRAQPRATTDGKNLKGKRPVSASRAQQRPVPARQQVRREEAPRVAVRKKPRFRVPGQDISWPQCPGRANQPMPYEDIRFLIIGLTNGPSFTRNPCVKMHHDWAKRHRVWTAAYAFGTFPHDWQIKRLGATGPYNGRHWLGRVQNTAWKAAVFNIRTMRQHGFRTPHVWIDVEQSSSRPWTGNKRWNQAVLTAWIKAYEDAGYTTGIYSSRYIWQGIMGDHRTGRPEWRTAGPASFDAATARCHERPFQGGRAVVSQWWTSRRDFNRMCPGFQDDAKMKWYFAKY